MHDANPAATQPFSAPAEVAFDYARIAPFVGASSEWHDGHDEVSESDIRHWCEVMQDPNPLYTDEAYATQSRYGGLIAPPVMVQTWSLDPMKAALDRFVRNDPPFKEDPHNQLFGAIDAMGYHGVVATAQSQEYLRPVRPGDMLRSRITVGNVSRYDHYTRMGVGRYVDLIYTFINQRDEEVCVASFRVLKYRPPLDTRRLYQG
ncbi:MAG: MaoC family dehydratase N-terminal domain-containing protein [Candidatus Binatia bacterium]